MTLTFSPISYPVSHQILFDLTAHPIILTTSTTLCEPLTWIIAVSSLTGLSTSIFASSRIVSAEQPGQSFSQTSDYMPLSCSRPSNVISHSGVKSKPHAETHRLLLSCWPYLAVGIASFSSHCPLAGAGCPVTSPAWAFAVSSAWTTSARLSLRLSPSPSH